MAYDKGTFYHESGAQVIDGVTILNGTISSNSGTGVSLLTGATAPTVGTLAPVGALYVCTGSGIVSLYQNTGTALIPVWTELNAIDTGNLFTSFTIPTQVGESVINSTLGTIAITVPYGTSPAALVATFTRSQDAVVTVGGLIQVNASTANNFTSPVTYVVTSEAGVGKNYVVTVTVELNDETDITAYSLAEVGEIVDIDSEAHTVSVVLVNGSTIGTYTPTFTLSGDATATISEVEQESGVTSADFSVATGSNPKTYTITAQDGTTTQDWTVTVTVAAE